MIKITRHSLVDNCGFSLRARNVLINNSENFGVQWTPEDACKLKLSHLEGFSLIKLNSLRNSGKKTVAEIVDCCRKAGVKLNP